MKVFCQLLMFLPVALLPATPACEYSCLSTGSCQVVFRGSPRTGGTKGTCFPQAFGGKCAGTPPECEDCNLETDCEMEGGVEMFKDVPLKKDAEGRDSSDHCSYSCGEKGSCRVIYTGPLEEESAYTQGACYPLSFGGKCFGTPSQCKPCNQEINCEDGDQTRATPTPARSPTPISSSFPSSPPTSTPSPLAAPSNTPTFVPEFTSTPERHLSSTHMPSTNSPTNTELKNLYTFFKTSTSATPYASPDTTTSKEMTTTITETTDYPTLCPNLAFQECIWQCPGRDLLIFRICVAVCTEDCPGYIENTGGIIR